MSNADEGRDRGLDSAHEWLRVVAAEFGLDPEVIRPLVKDLLDLTRDVAHGPSRPAAPLTAFLVGLASGRGMNGDEDIGAVVARVRERIGVVDELLAEREHSRADG